MQMSSKRVTNRCNNNCTAYHKYVGWKMQKNIAKRRQCIALKIEALHTLSSYERSKSAPPIVPAPHPKVANNSLTFLPPSSHHAAVIRPFSNHDKAGEEGNNRSLLESCQRRKKKRRNSTLKAWLLPPRKWAHEIREKEIFNSFFYIKSGERKVGQEGRLNLEKERESFLSFLFGAPSSVWLAAGSQRGRDGATADSLDRPNTEQQEEVDMVRGNRIEKEFERVLFVPLLSTEAPKLLKKCILLENCSWSLMSHTFSF